MLLLPLQQYLRARSITCSGMQDLLFSHMSAVSLLQHSLRYLGGPYVFQQGCSSDSALLMQVALPRKGDRMRTEEEDDDVMDDDEAADASEEGAFVSAIFFPQLQFTASVKRPAWRL